MLSFKGWCQAAMAVGAIALATAPGLGEQVGRLAALAKLEQGLWQLRDLDSGERLPAICVADPAMLMQLQHRNSPCSRLVISSDAESATVHYTCPASGFGRTSLRVETPRLAQIDTQGISENAPFAYRVEARRIGPCPSSRGRAGR